MVRQAKTLKWKQLGSELEALLIEAELIRLHQPEFNVLLKDDKSPIYVYISDKIYPQVKTVRRRDIYQKNLKGTILGPFQSAYKLKQVLRLARKIFPWCDKAQARLKRHQADSQNKAQDELKQFKQACFYQHLDLCPGACIGQISPDQYRKNLDQLVLFLRGKTKEVVTNLSKQMKSFSQQLQYEQAGQIKRKIDLINDVTKKNYRLKPDLVLPALHDSQVKNSLNHLRKILNDFLDLPREYRLKRIEGYDVSNIQGKNAAVSMVAFKNGLPDKKNYRLFNIRGLDTPNDYQMLKEAISRRQKHPEWGKPHLLVIDGGRGQLRAALTVWDWAAPVISIAKDPDRIIIPVNHYRSSKTNRLKINYQTLRLPEDHPTLQLVQHIRDESHRFAKKQHARLRRKNMIEA
jgi:excinuclease ABC subunit C